MTIRQCFIALYPDPTPAPPSGVPRIDQLNALALFARSQLDIGFSGSRPHTIGAISRLLFNCHSLLSRLEERHTVTAPTEKDLEYEREEEISRYAMLKLVRTHPELEEEFYARREEVKNGNY